MNFASSYRILVIRIRKADLHFGGLKSGIRKNVETCHELLQETFKEKY